MEEFPPSGHVEIKEECRGCDVAASLSSVYSVHAAIQRRALSGRLLDPDKNRALEIAEVARRRCMAARVLLASCTGRLGNGSCPLRAGVTRADDPS